MALMNAEYRDRLGHWMRTLESDLYAPLDEIRFEGFATMDHLAPDRAAVSDAFRPVPAGTEWGHTWEYMWVRSRIVLPPEAEGKRIVMALDFPEATLFVNGEPFGTRRAEWVNVNAQTIEDNILTLNGHAGDAFDLLFEVYAGHYYPDAGGCATGPVIPGTFLDPAKEGRRSHIGRCTFGIWNEDAYQLLLDVSTLRGLMDELPEDSLRASKIADGLERFTRTVDFEQDADARTETYRAARAELRPLMSAKNGDTSPLMIAVGNAHLDLAWLWPQQETHRKTARTFAAQLRLLDMYPDYCFIQSQPAEYEMCKRYYPGLYRKIREAVKAGRWIADGAMYVEPDTNMPSGEALVRQVVYGKRFYKEEFGTESRMLWLPDTFGYTAALPQILKSCGVDYLVTQKIFWSYNDGDRFPYHYFRWRGMDGTEITSFLPTSYTYHTDPKTICSVWRSRVQKRSLDEFLFPFGYGDGGGGPSRDHIEYALRARDLEGMPRIEMASPLKLFDDLEKKGGAKNTWDGELYFNAHRGTYTVQAAVKRNNRRSEGALHEAELWGALAALNAGKAYPAADAARLWKTLLLHQFHDILPGSSIARVYEEANAAHAALQAEALGLAEGARKALVPASDGLTVFNSLGFARTERVKLPDGMTNVRTAEGESVPAMNGEALVTVPALGWVSLIAADAPCAVRPASAERDGDGYVLRNEKLCVRLNAQGEIVSCADASGREFAAGPMNRLLMYKDVPRKFDAWDIDSNYLDLEPETARITETEIAGFSGLCACVIRRGTIGCSSFTQTISLEVGKARVTFDTEVDWHELHRLLKAAFPVNVRAENALHEMQFGCVERPAHRSRAYDRGRFEVCNHRWTALADNSHGCAVLNDCKYGVSVCDGTIALSLLRAGASPELRSDQGRHRFTYAFTVWEGPFAASPVVREGMELNTPVQTAPGQAGAYSFASVDAENVIIDTVKPAEDGSGDVILRLYESMKADTAFTLRLDRTPAKVVLCNMLEESRQELPAAREVDLHARAFEVITVRVKF